jgi:DNA-directed RNA polymerase specialized sigma24 family protein
MRRQHRDTLGATARRWLNALRSHLFPLARKIDDESFRRALDSLGPEVRAVYEGHLRGNDRAAIARELGISEDAAGERLSDARRQLRSLLFSSRAARHQP